MKIEMENNIVVSAGLMLTRGGWRRAESHEEKEDDYLYPCQLKLNYIHWTEGDEEDNDPVYGFMIVTNPSDKNYPEFSLMELKQFLRDGTMYII